MKDPLNCWKDTSKRLYEYYQAHPLTLITNTMFPSRPCADLEGNKELMCCVLWYLHT